jgi:hypothetical protein
MNGKIIFVLIAATIVLAGCSAKHGSYAGSITGNIVASDESLPKKFTILYADGRYSPDEISVNQGAVVMIDFIDKSNSTSLFIIDGYAEENVVNGKTRFFFSADNEGVFEYGLRDRQSKGKLRIS